ncbi:ABC-2 type transport system ATP-binding protein [Stackebrandtia endophytica]|uniref:ABC-2 type transport system ATP-binding protein n=1 Tax=Stackebrandtia endophytica TaxID=1496996 RepID=A0A543B0D5_9ACTN|nr:ABC transporter ATP-binding protein [Stackebrandtia endophytica]TQL78256.1 ABC-2 type transport system ATP-binding protein [Stackebrandtia endophytica]
MNPHHDHTDTALRVRGIRRVFGSSVAVDSVDLTVSPASFYGLVGPNGAGKSTLIGCAVGLDRPDAGTSSVFGVDVWDNPLEARRQLGVLPDNLALPEYLSGRELLHYWGQLHGIDAEQVKSRAGELLTLFELDGSVEQTLIIDYSTGMRKKIGLAVALLHSPRLLVLDEPFEAVDPVSAITIRRILEQFVHTGGSIIMSSHSMSLVEQLCDTVAIMANGRVAIEGPLDDVRATDTLEDAFIRTVGVPQQGGNLSWLG